MTFIRSVWIPLSLVFCGRADVDVPSTSPAIRYVGRFDKSEAGARFDRNGCELQFQIQGVSQLKVQISQRLTASYPLGLNPVGSQIQHFLVYIDGEPLSTPITGSACSFCTFDTSKIANETVTEYTIATGLSAAAHEVRIMKTTEPEWNDREPSPNWITFHGLSHDGDADGVSSPATARRAKRIEFIGDSITAGYCNLCKGPGPFDVQEAEVASALSGGEGEETFALSWPTVICEKLGAECSTVAWSGLGLVKNCCGGETFMPEIWKRTLATDSGAQWDFSSWVPDALVINLGTNDGATGATPEFVAGYEKLVHEARSVYGDDLRVFLACGPMSETYCDSVQQTITNATAAGIHAHFLDQRNFLNGTFGPACCGHPGVQVDAAMGAAGAQFIASTLGWTAVEALV